MALHRRDAVTVSVAVATRSHADCSSMEGHTSLSTALVLVRHVMPPRIRDMYHIHHLAYSVQTAAVWKPKHSPSSCSPRDASSYSRHVSYSPLGIFSADPHHLRSHR